MKSSERGSSSAGRKRPGRRPTQGITEPQRRTLKEIREFIAHKGYPPTILEVAEVLGISPASAHDQLSQLVQKEYLRREPRKARGLTIIREPDDEVAELTPVAILGTVTAGQPIFAEENVVGEVLVESQLARSGRCFALEVTGDSMIGAGIHERDLVIVRQQPLAESGDIVVALLGGEATMKRLYIRGEQIELKPENQRLRSIPIGPDDDLRILGKVVAVRRNSTRGYFPPRKRP